MDVTSDTADITLRTPGDLLSAVPYLVGYQPRSRFILIGLNDREIRVVSCVPLPERHALIEDLPISATMLRHNDVTAAVLVGYGPPGSVTRCVDHVRALLESAGVELVDALRVTEGRYWSYVCARAGCCPAEGTPLRAPDSAVDAAFAVNGVQAMPSREAVVARLEPVGGSERARVTRATRKLRNRLRDNDDSLLPDQQTLAFEGRAVLERVSEGALPDVNDVVLLGAALHDTALRGEALIAIDHKGPQRSLDSWVWLTRHVGAADRAVPAALLAYAAWRGGNGVLAGEAVRRALADDPECELARMIGRILAEGLPPSAIPKIVGERS